MKKAGCLLTSVLALVLAIGAIWFLSGWWGSAQVEDDTNFIVPSGASLTSVAHKLADEGLISDPRGFLLRAKIFGSSDPIMAGLKQRPRRVSGRCGACAFLDICNGTTEQ